jgi:Secretion system C-terminal sorting domain
MKNICLLLLLSPSIQTIAQWPEFNQTHPISCQWPAFNYTANGEMENVFFVNTLPDFYDGYLLFGNGVLCHPDSVVNNTRCFAAKCNTNGDLVWWQRYDNEEIDMSEQWFNVARGNRGGMIQNHESDIVSTFSTFISGDEFNSESKDYLVTLNSDGEIIERHLIDSSFAGYSFFGLIEDLSDSTYVAHGWYMDSLDVINNNEPDAFLLKLDSLGNHIWQMEYSDTYGTYDVIKAMDGGFWVCANTPGFEDCSDGFFQNNDFILIKTDEFGIEEDRITFGGSCSNEIATIYEYEEDKVILAGRLTNEENDPDAMFAGYYYSTLIEQQPNEVLVETTARKEYLPTYNGDFVDLHVKPNVGYLIVCDNQLTTAQGSGPEWRWMGGLLMLDANRDSLWFRKYSYYNNFPGTGLDYPARHYLLDSKPTPDGGFVCSGYIDQRISDPNPYLLTPWIFKVDSLGCVEPGCQDVGVSEIVIGMQNVMSVYPNPASSFANITFNLPADFSPSKDSELIILDMQGREIMRQGNLMLSQKNPMVTLDFSIFSSGIYTAHWILGTAWLDSVKISKE